MRNFRKCPFRKLGRINLVDHILIERNESVAYIRLNDPATRNAINPGMIQRIGEYFQNLPEDVRAVILTGSEKAFSSGANMWGDSQFDMTAPDYDAGETLRTTINPMMQSIKASPVPVISAASAIAAPIPTAAPRTAEMTGTGLALIDCIIGLIVVRNVSPAS